MKKFTITKAEGSTEVWEKPGKIGRPDSVELYGADDMQVSDGFHTMDEVYAHRVQLFIALCSQLAKAAQALRAKHDVWKSKVHADGTAFDGWFVMGIGTKKGEQITYHLPMNKWDETKFAKEMVRAPEFDGHTASDVLGRLKSL